MIDKFIELMKTIPTKHIHGMNPQSKQATFGNLESARKFKNTLPCWTVTYVQHSVEEKAKVDAYNKKWYGEQIYQKK